MIEIHEYTDGIYESLCDDDIDMLKESVDNLYKVLEDIDDSFLLSDK